MEKSERKTYCRACGENKGHSFSGCTNYRNMREIVKEQDHEMENMAASSAKYASELREYDHTKLQVQGLSRMINALLDLVESRRAK